MDRVRIILDLPVEGGNATWALQAALSLRNSDHKDCVYSIGGKDFWAKKNKASISVRQLEAKKVK